MFLFPLLEVILTSICRLLSLDLHSSIKHNEKVILYIPFLVNTIFPVSLRNAISFPHAKRVFQHNGELLYHLKLGHTSVRYTKEFLHVPSCPGGPIGPCSPVSPF